MVSITTRSTGRLNTDALNFADMLFLATQKLGSKSYSAIGIGGIGHEFKGTNFKYQADGTPKSGTVTSYSFVSGFEKAFTITGFTTSIAKIVSLAQTGYSTDDKQFFTSLFKGNDVMNGGKQGDTINGGSGNDKLYGKGGIDTLKGANGNDVLDGGDGMDTLYGGKGNDKLIGAKGADTMIGGGGADTFVFRSGSDSNQANGVDRIVDFSYKAGDRIDLRTIDANTKASGNQPFKFIGTDEFHGKAGELRYERDTGHVLGDRNGDGLVDFMLHIENTKVVKADFFFL